MTRACWRWIGLLLVLGGMSELLWGCSTIDSRSSQAAGVDLAQYRTFQFAQAQYPSDPRFFSPSTQARVEAAIRHELGKHGVRLGEPADLQLWVYLKTEIKPYDKSAPPIDPVSVGANLGTYYGLTYYEEWGTQHVVTYPLGTLVVQALDVSQDRIVWEGTATTMLHRSLTDKQLESHIRRAVSGMFKGFPKAAERPQK